MTRKDIKREVHAVLVDMDVSPKSITDTASFQKDLGLDSLDYVNYLQNIDSLLVNLSN